ncbi:MAG: aldehyde dehydrogenase family protein [Flavobacteriales bacterium]|nr:aldehyde dehydrogenase family protein [Flavobacteriales bacterium]
MQFESSTADQVIARLHACRDHFARGTTRSYKARQSALKALRSAIKKHEEALLTAMYTDMRKPRFEAYLGDVGLVYSEIDHTLAQLKGWMRPERPSTPLSLQVASSEVRSEPLGVVLIIAPWNYPALLVFSPLIGAIAAGNCAVVKPSNEAPATAAVIETILSEVFAQEHVLVVQGAGRDVGPKLIEPFRFDHIFFTGSPRVGRLIMALAAPHLTPVTLELGGKSPAIVDRTADVERAAQRIVWSRYFNAGQTCIATDHVLVHAEVMEPFLQAVAKYIERFYGTDPKASPHFARLVNDKRFEAVRAFLNDGQILIGGENDASERYIAPTVLTDVPLDAPVMQEEIFGPVLPVIPWTTREEVLEIVARNSHPLATYVFSNDRKAQRFFTAQIAFGGGCINHCLLQFGNPEMTFGGVGNSGMGRYHGKATFDLFSHHKGIVHASTLIEPGVQYPPYSSWKERILRFVLR